MTGHVTSRYQGLNSSEVGAKIENLGTRLTISCAEILYAKYMNVTMSYWQHVTPSYILHATLADLWLNITYSIYSIAIVASYLDLAVDQHMKVIIYLTGICTDVKGSR